MSSIGTWVMTVPALLAILALSLRQRVNPNWPAVFHLGGVLLATGWLTEQGPRRQKFWRAAWLTAAGLGAGLVLAYVLARLLANLFRGVRPDDPLVARVVGGH